MGTDDADLFSLLAHIAHIPAVILSRPHCTPAQITGERGEQLAFVGGHSLLTSRSDTGNDKRLVNIHPAADTVNDFKPWFWNTGDAGAENASSPKAEAKTFSKYSSSNRLTPRVTFYYRLKQMNRADKYETAKAEMTDIYHENKGRYGYRRITTELPKSNVSLNHKTVQRLMKKLDLVCHVRMRKYRSYKREVGRIP